MHYVSFEKLYPLRYFGDRIMKIQIILFHLILLTSFSLKAITWNPCIAARKTKAYRYLRLNSKSMETCYTSTLRLINSRKTTRKGVALMAKFLYVKNNLYRHGAILELGNSDSKKAIVTLRKKGLYEIDRNRRRDLKVLTSSLIALGGEEAVLKLARYSKARKKFSIMRAIRDEYFVFTNGSYYHKMENIAGEAPEPAF